MSVYYGTMTSKGQTTIPAEVRDLLDLKPGDKIRYIHQNGGIVMKAKNRPALALAGKFHDPNRAAFSLEEIDDAILEAALDHVDRSR